MNHKQHSGRTLLRAAVARRPRHPVFCVVLARFQPAAIERLAQHIPRLVINQFPQPIVERIRVVNPPIDVRPVGQRVINLPIPESVVAVDLLVNARSNPGDVRPGRIRTSRTSPAFKMLRDSIVKDLNAGFQSYPQRYFLKMKLHSIKSISYN